MYETTARSLLQTDQDVTMGGNSVARQIRHNPEYPLQPNNEDSLKSAAANGIPMDFFSFHSITTALGIDQVGVMPASINATTPHAACQLRRPVSPLLCCVVVADDEMILLVSNVPASICF